MKKNRILSLIITAALPLSMISCSLDDYFNSSSKSSSVSESESESKSDKSDLYDKYSPVELDTVKEHIYQLQEDADVPENADKVQEDMQVLLDDLNAISESLSYITLSYYSDWYNEKLEAEYDDCYETYYVAYDLLSYAFANGYKIEEYSAIFEPYVDMEYIDYFSNRAMSMKRLEGYARVDYAVMNEYLDEYYDIAYNNKMNDKVKNLRAAEIYLDVLSSFDTETFYDSYNRDFTGEQAISLSNVIKNQLIPVSDNLGNIFYDMPVYDDVYDNPVLFDNPFEILAEYTNKISPEINQSAKFLTDNSLYTMTSGDESYTGSFTTNLPVQQSALIYTYQYGDNEDFTTAVHEFGHFHAALYDDTTTFMMKNNVDIAEIQSQGMEMLFMPLYDDIYEDQADAMRMMKLYNMLDSVISGFLIGEFEYTVLSNIDTMTPEDVLECFDSLMDENGYDVELYYISHLFEQPGYYISYGVSALAAFDIWEASVTDYDKAVEMYENISQIKCNSDEFQFKSALAQCGFNDVLDENYINNLAAQLNAYAENIG